MKEDTAPQLTERAGQIAEVLEHLHGFVGRHVQQDTLSELHDHELSLRQLGLLFYLRQVGSGHVSAVAGAMRLSLPATSHMIDRLVGRGLLLREENPLNRRQKQIALAPAGAGLLARLEGSTIAAYTRLFQHLPPEVVERFAACCLEVRAHLPQSPRCAPSALPTSPHDPSQEPS